MTPAEILATLAEAVASGLVLIVSLDSDGDPIASLADPDSAARPDGTTRVCDAAEFAFDMTRAENEHLAVDGWCCKEAFHRTLDQLARNYRAGDIAEEDDDD